MSFAEVNIHGIRVRFFYAVLKDGSSIVGEKSSERLFGAATKKTNKTLFLVVRFSKATTPFVVFFCISFYALICFVVSYPVR